MEPTPLNSNCSTPERPHPSTMRRYLVEAEPDYRRYHFPYTCMAEAEPGEAVGPLYADGFLPASDRPGETALRFYRARSLRLDLTHLTMDKKRRYLQRRGTAAGLRWSLLPRDACAASLPRGWEEKILEWVGRRHDPPFMDAERLAFVLARPFLETVAVVEAGDRWVGLVLLPGSGTWAHYWFCFFDPDWEPGLSLGRWILGETAARLGEAGFGTLYLGTVYGARSRYKFQGFETGVAFHDGNAWNQDRGELERRLAADPAPSDVPG